MLKDVRAALLAGREITAKGEHVELVDEVTLPSLHIDPVDSAMTTGSHDGVLVETDGPALIRMWRLEPVVDRDCFSLVEIDDTEMSVASQEEASAG